MFTSTHARQFRMRRFAWMGALSTTLSCQSVQDAPHPAATTPATNPSPNANQGAVRIFPAEFWPGKTNVPPNDARLAFVMERTTGEPKDHVVMLAAQAAFRDELSGKKIPAKVEAGAQKGEPSLAPFYFAPELPLKPDAWYHLEISSSAKLSVDGIPAPGLWSRPFFTGSAPHVSRIEVIAKSNQVRVEFSEPIEAKNLSASQVLALVGHGSASCLYQAGECINSVGADGPILRELVFQFAATVSTGASKPVVNVTVPGTLKGSPRTVSAGKQAAATPWADGAQPGNVVFSTGDGTWSSCHEGVAQCWSYER